MHLRPNVRRNGRKTPCKWLVSLPTCRAFRVLKLHNIVELFQKNGTVNRVVSRGIAQADDDLSVQFVRVATQAIRACHFETVGVRDHVVGVGNAFAVARASEVIGVGGKDEFKNIQRDSAAHVAAIHEVIVAFCGIARALRGGFNEGRSADFYVFVGDGNDGLFAIYPK